MAAPTVPVMFLGGPLDHAVRQVVAHPEDSSRPAREDFLAPVNDRPGSTTASNDRLRYALQLVRSGPYRWWTYIAVGHTPSPRALLDAAPTKVFQGSPR